MASLSGATAVHATLAANTVDTVTLTDESLSVEVVNRNGAAEVYFTVNGTTPTVGGNDCYVLPAAIGSLVVASPGADVVKLISSGTPAYSVQAVK